MPNKPDITNRHPVAAAIGLATDAKTAA